MALGLHTHLSTVELVGVVVVAVRAASSAPSAHQQHKAIPLVSDQARARKHTLGSGPSLWRSLSNVGWRSQRTYGKHGLNRGPFAAGALETRRTTSARAMENTTSIQGITCIRSPSLR